MKIVLSALFSEQYPSTGESHGLSVVAGQLVKKLGGELKSLRLFDMVALGREAIPDLIEVLRTEDPDVVGISVTYGTFTLLAGSIAALRDAAPRAVFAYGGPLATYLVHDILALVDPLGIVFVGESECSFSDFVAAKGDRNRLKDLPNVAFREEGSGQVVQTSRGVALPGDLAVPYRSHLQSHVAKDIQLYSETSRGCSWSHCTFCLRGLLDTSGSGKEYRALPPKRILADLNNLHAMGARSVTFADEDFLGHSLAHAQAIADVLCEFAARHDGMFAFDASVTVHSIVSEKMGASELAVRRELLARLKSAGLRKVFLGVESGAPSQLRRFAKGHSRQEAAAAISEVRAAGIAVELGWIMFDPLCTPADVESNVDFLVSNQVVDATSFLFNELRLQEGTSYIRLLDNFERRHGRRLHGRDLDRDTLSYSYEYADPLIEQLVALVRTWSRRIRPLHYPLKNLTRYGVSGELAAPVAAARVLLSEFRHRMCECLLLAMRTMGRGAQGDEMDVLAEPLRATAEKVRAWSETLSEAALKNELVAVIRRNALELCA